MPNKAVDWHTNRGATYNQSTRLLPDKPAMACGHEATSFQGGGAVRPKGFDLARLRGYELSTTSAGALAADLSNVVAFDAPHAALLPCCLRRFL